MRFSWQAVFFSVIIILLLTSTLLTVNAYLKEALKVGTVNVTALRSDKSFTCPENQFFFFGCHPVGTLSIPNPTAGCGHNGLMCANYLCPDGYTMPSSNCELTITIPSSNTSCYTGSNLQNGLCVPNNSSTSKLPRPVKLMWNGADPRTNYFGISVKYSNNATQPIGLTSTDVGKYISQGISFEDDWTSYCQSTYPTAVYIGGVLEDFKCSDSSHCPSGTVFQNNLCMTTEKSAVGSITSGLSIQDQINFNINKTSFQSPLQQTKSGIAVNDIVCRHNLQLVVKKDGSPACVKPQTAKKLVERGWLITNNQIAVSKVWVKIWSGQCHTDPWIDDWKKSHNTFPKWSSQKELFEIIKNYYEKQGIIVFGVNQSANWQNTENCGAGGYYYLLVANSDVNKMLEFGFTQSTTQNPVQIVSVKTIPTNPKVGDNLQFNLTIRNKANYPIYYGSTCGFPPLGVSFTPAESIQVSPSLPCACLAAPPVLPIPPNDTISWTYPQSCFGGTWTILKSGIIVVKSTFVWGITSLNPQTNVTSMVSTFNLLPNEEKNGTLSGNVSIQGGVACGSPMYPCKDPSVNYEVDVYANDGVTIVGKTFSDSNDHYSIQLPAGNYIVYTYPIPKQIPHPVSIIAGQNTIFDIAYDNGLR